MRSSRVALLVLVAGLVIGGGSHALAHGEVEDETPPEGANLNKTPRHVYVTFTEAPTKDGRLEVFDGCGDMVISRLQFLDTTLHADIKKETHPGKWRVTYNVISAEDGHKTNGAYRFDVKGAKGDCSPDPDPDETDDPDDGTADGEFPLVKDEGSGFPVVPVALGAVVLIGLAFAVRKMSAR
jgi:methionine-rich copper-binding protein CopC